MNNYGVFKTSINGTVQWVEQEFPLTLTSDPNNAIDNWSYADACSVATYLSQSGESFNVGRPDDRHP